MTTLYRQYRPQGFRELIGQEHVTQTLQQAITKDRIAHAYLFYGPRGTGKTSTARILAKRLNCLNATDAEPCGTCAICVATQNNQNIDLIEIDAASNRGIDDIRALKEGMGLKPAMAKYKVYIIDEVHMLTNEAFTALLKTLEEPVSHAIFILATTELHKVPETILSRCQVFRFRRATDTEMRQRLTYLLEQEKRQADDAAIDFIISRSDGCFRDAESLLGQMLTLTDENTISRERITEFLGLPPAMLIDQFLLALIKGESAPALTAIQTAFADGYDPEQFVKESIRRARTAAVAIAAGKTNEAFSDHAAAAQRLPLIIRSLLQALQDLAYVPEPLIALELVVLTLTSKKGETTPSPATTLERPKVITAPPKAQAPPAPSKKPAPVATSASQAVTAEQVKAIWMDVIQAVKKANPVASTFLRAMEPTAVETNTVRLRAQYALHRNFFDKPTNQVLVTDALSQLLKTPVTILCYLEEQKSGTTSWQSESNEKGEELLAAVQEVFGK